MTNANNILNINKINIYPNPIDDILKININNWQKSVQIELFNALGQKIYSDLYFDEEEIKLDFSNNSSGMYCLKIISDGKFFTFNVVKK